jgi:hypothetical protein
MRVRRWCRFKGLTKQVAVVRVEQAVGRVCFRRCPKRGRLFAHYRGFVTVNDGPAFASQLARYLAPFNRWGGGRDGERSLAVTCRSDRPILSLPTQEAVGYR